MTKSKMRIYKGCGYSDHEVDLFMSIDEEDAAHLHIVTPHEGIRLQADDVIAELWPRVLECVDDALDEALYEVLNEE